MENRTQQQQQRFHVPDELRETLLDFTIAYLLERPSNLPLFGLQFFQRLTDEREGKRPGPRPPPAPDSIDNEPEGNDNAPYVLDDLLTDWIIQFTIIYVIEKPTDIYEFGLMWFKRKMEAAEAHVTSGSSDP